MTVPSAFHRAIEQKSKMKTTQAHPYPWQAIQKDAGKEITAMNPLDLGRPFKLTDDQRIELQPAFEASGIDGAVLIVCTYSRETNFLTARPIPLSPAQRKSLSASLTRFARSGRYGDPKKQ